MSERMQLDVVPRLLLAG